MAKRLQRESERLRGKVMEMVKRGQKTLKAASLELGISYRQAKRVYQSYLNGGDRALVHGNKGKPSNHQIDLALVQQALFLYAEKYNDFGPTFAQEKLLERDRVKSSVSSLRRAKIAARLWIPERIGQFLKMPFNRSPPPMGCSILPYFYYFFFHAFAVASVPSYIDNGIEI